MTDKRPKVSVLVPVYNVERYIERCAVSLFEQTYDNCEYVFVNDCTKDRSVDILSDVIDRYPTLSGRIKIINHQVNKGLGAARLTGVNNSSGEYITFVDSDDYVSNSYVEKLVENMLALNPDIVLSSYNISDKLMEVSVDWYERRVLGGRMSCRIWGSLLKRSIMTSCNIYPVVGIDYAEDFAFMTRYVSEADKIIILPETIYHYTDDNTDSYVHNVSEKDVHSLCRALKTVSEYLTRKDKRKYSRMVRYAIFEKAIGITKNLGNSESVLSLNPVSDSDIWETCLRRSIQAKKALLIKTFSYICYKRL